MRRAASYLILFLVVLVGLPRRSDAQTPVTDVAHIATSVWAEVARYAQAIEDFIVQTEQIYNQYLQIEYQVQALRKLDVHAWRDVSPAFSRLLALGDDVDAVLYNFNPERLEERFFETFPAGERYVNYSDDSWRALFRTMETFRVSLRSLHEITSSDELDLATLAQIEAEIEGAEGHEQVLEGIGNLLSWTAKQTLLAERINAAQANAETVAKAYEINEAARSRESYSAFLESTVLDAVAGAHDLSSPRFRALPHWMPQ
jgi:P-type conjugative transfer protein TrbJ